MSIVRTVVAKDVRRFGAMAGFAAVTIILDQILSAGGWLQWAPSEAHFVDGVSFVFAGLKWPIVTALTSVLIQEDLLVSERPFWRTRPIDRLDLFRAKAIFLTLSIGLPTVLARSVGLFLVRAPFGQSTVLVGESLAKMASVVIVIAAAAALTKSIIQMTVAIAAVICGLVLAVTTTISLLPRHTIPLPWDNSVAENGPRILFLILVLSLGIGGVVALFYRRLNRRNALFQIAAVTLVGFILADLWTPGTSARVKPIEPSGDWDHSAASLKASITNVTGRGYTVPGPPYRLTLRGSVAIHGIPAGDELRLLNIESVISGTGGASFSFSQGYDHPQISWYSGRDFYLSLGEPDLAKSVRNQSDANFELFRSSDPALPNGIKDIGTLVSRLRVQGLRQEVVFRVPFEAGATYTAHGQRWRISDIRFTQDDSDTVSLSGHWRPHFVLSLTSPSSLLIPVSPFDDPWTHVDTYVILAPDSGTYTSRLFTVNEPVSGELSGYSQSRRLLGIDRVHHVGQNVSGDLANPAWLAHAQLVGLRMVPIGITILEANVATPSAVPIDRAPSP